MTESKICTCPSGDGSLRHPCPAHPALVEQAGGDERAAFEAAFAAMGRPVCRADYDQDAYGTPFDDGGWTGWQARAALAQPSGEVVVTKNESGAIVSVTRQDKEGRVLSVIAESATLTAQAEQAEAERPEVVATMYTHHDDVDFREFVVVGNCDKGCEGFYGPEKLMTVAQHERIVKAWIERWKAYIELSAKIAAQRDAADARLHEVATACATAEQERDAALARVAELEACGAPALLAAADYFAERAKGPSPGWVTLSAVAKELRVRADKAPVAQAQQLHDLDKQCRDDVARALGLRPNQERGFAWSYLLASIKSCVKASEDSAQAQHSVPETTNEEANSFLRVADAGQFKDNAVAVRTAAVIIRSLLHRPALMQSIIRHRIGLTPEYEGQWHADLYGEDGEVQHHAEADTPDEAVRAVVALAAAPSQAQHSVPEGWVQSLPLKDHQPCKPNEDRANGYTIPIYSRPVLVEEALRKLRAVLCDPIGNVVIDGSDGDREEVQRALGMLAAAPGKEGV